MNTKAIRIQSKGKTIGEITVDENATNSEVITQWFRENPNSTGTIKRVIFGKNFVH